MRDKKYFVSMNSLMFVEVEGLTKKNVDSTIFEIIKIIGIFEKRWSIFSKGSTICKLNRAKNRWCHVEAYTADILKRANRFTQEIGAEFSIFSGAYARTWKEALITEKVPEKYEIEKLKKKFCHANIQIKGRFIKMNEEEVLDLGGCAKGYIADYVKQKFIKKKGIQTIILNLGGNVLVSSKENIEVQVEIENPVNNSKHFIWVKDESVVTSGDYVQCFLKDKKLYHHIIDLKSGYPVESPFSSVTVCGKEGFICDCFATYFYIKGLESIEECKKNRIAALFIFKDGKVISTSKLIKGDCRVK